MMTSESGSETRPCAVSFHFGIPLPHQIQALKDAGILTMVSATNFAEAKAIQQGLISSLLKALRLEVTGVSLAPSLMPQSKPLIWSS